jgi:hypothetical protein
LAPELVRAEEVAVVHHLPGTVPLTVVLDGLDEAGNPDAVRRGVRFWLHSRLGQRGVLVVSSRREFWRACVDPAWGRWMPASGEEDRVTTTPAERADWRQPDPAQGLRLPGLFSPEELERAWVRAGQPATALYGLAPEVSEELRHPFTLRAFLDLRGQADNLPPLPTRTDIMAAWLDARLRAEEDRVSRLTQEEYREALHAIATRVDGSGSGWVGVGQLADVPRFNQARPPGPVVERLLQAGLLESLPGRHDRIRFVFEAVHDFFLAEVDAARVAKDPEAAALGLARPTFSEAFVRLDRVGRRIVQEGRRDEFLAALAALDPFQAAVVLRAAPLAYSPPLRGRVIEGVRQDIHSRYLLRAAFAVDLLGRIDCPESRRALLESLPPGARGRLYLRVVGARAMIRLGCVEGVELVYAHPWFSIRKGGEAYYFQGLMAELRGAPDEFRSALADHAVRFLAAASGTAEHGRAVYVLGYLGDERLVPNLEGRLANNGSLQEYENHALIAVGSEAAASLYGRSVRSAAAELSRLGNEEGSVGVFLRIAPKKFDLSYLFTPHFERLVEQLIQDGDKEVAEIGVALAGTVRSPRLLHRSLVTQARRRESRGLSLDRFAEGIDPTTWLSWWEGADSDEARVLLLGSMSPIPNVEVEQVLIGCLDNKDLRGLAAEQLGLMGSVRASVHLRRLLEQGVTGWDCISVIRGIGWLRDSGAVESLTRAAATVPGVINVATVSLGLIGTPEAEAALMGLIEQGADAERVATGLLLHGSEAAVARAVEVARARPERGAGWLARCPGHWTTCLGRTAGRYFTHIHDARLVQYLWANEQAFRGEEKSALIHAVDQIDDENVREMLRTLASREGTAEDDVVRDGTDLRASTLAYRELARRGDGFAAEHFVREAVGADERRSWAADRALAGLPAEHVRMQLRLALDRAGNDDERAEVIRLLGFFGDEGDGEAVRQFVDSSDTELAEAAHEALCRLTDPLLIPPNWSRL